MQAVEAELRTDFVVVLTGVAPLPLVHSASVYVYAGLVPSHVGAGVASGVTVSFCPAPQWPGIWQPK